MPYTLSAWLAAAQVLTEQVGSLVCSIVDARQLCIDTGKAAWLAYLDIYVLDAGQRRASLNPENLFFLSPEALKAAWLAFLDIYILDAGQQLASKKP